MKRRDDAIRGCFRFEHGGRELFGISPEGFTIEHSLSNEEGPISMARRLVERFPFRIVALPLRKSISSDANILGGILYDGKEAFFFSVLYHQHDRPEWEEEMHFRQVLFTSLRQKMKGADAIDFAVAFSCIKHTYRKLFLISQAWKKFCLLRREILRAVLFARSCKIIYRDG